MQAIRKPTMTITIEHIDVRFTAGGQRMAVIYAKDLSGMSFQVWDHGIVTGAIMDALIEMEGESIDIVGKLDVMVYKGYDGRRNRRNVFVVEGWKRLDDDTPISRDKNTQVHQ